MLKVSIITISLNCEATIEFTINSVLSQSYSNIEYIIIDGASTDGTLEIIESFSDRISVVVSEHDNGIYDAMNKGLKIASGDVIGILNPGDFYPNAGTIEKVVNTFNSEVCDSLYGNLDFVLPLFTDKIIRYWKSEPFKTGAFSRGWHPPHPTFFVKKYIYEKYGLFDTSYKVSADFELMIRFLEKYKISTYFLDETLVKMRYGGVSNSSLKGIITGNRNILRAFKTYGIKFNRYYTCKRLVFKLSQFFRR